MGYSEPAFSKTFAVRAGISTGGSSRALAAICPQSRVLVAGRPGSSTNQSRSHFSSLPSTFRVMAFLISIASSAGEGGVCAVRKMGQVEVSCVPTNGEIHGNPFLDYRSEIE